MRDDPQVRRALEAAREHAVLAAAVRDTARMLSVLDSHVAYLEDRRARQGLEFLQVPSQNQQFFYRTDSGGVIRLQQDAAFVAEQIFFSSAQAQSTHYLSLTDISSSRSTTTAYRPGGNNVFSPADVMPTDSVLVPMRALIPMRLTELADYYYVLPTEWQLPRGGVLQVAVLDFGGPALVNNPGLFELTLGGYKVFG